MANTNFEYTAVVRTLGKAGQKYQTLLNSLCAQTIHPKAILVYIADGYPIPKETCGKEQYIHCAKGMVHQRSLPFTEVETEWMLLCDDDISLENNSVELLLNGLKNYDTEKSVCIAPDVFPNSKASFLQKIRYAIGFTFPHYKKKWAFIIRQSAHYSYNNISERKRPSVLRTQSAAGPCCLVNKKAYASIHFEDERFLDDFKYALGDDQLFFYKLYRMGFVVLVHYSAGIVHLDAGSSHLDDHSEHLRACTAALFTVWNRSRFGTAGNPLARLWCAVCYLTTVGISILFRIVQGFIKRDFKSLISYIKGIHDGIQYIHSEKYRNLPPFLGYRNTKENP